MKFSGLSQMLIALSFVLITSCGVAVVASGYKHRLLVTESQEALRRDMEDLLALARVTHLYVWKAVNKSNQGDQSNDEKQNMAALREDLDRIQIDNWKPNDSSEKGIEEIISIATKYEKISRSPSPSANEDIQFLRGFLSPLLNARGKVEGSREVVDEMARIYDFHKTALLIIIAMSLISAVLGVMIRPSETAPGGTRRMEVNADQGER